MPASSEKKLFINDGVTVDSKNSTENEESVISLLVKPPENHQIVILWISPLETAADW
eukprot:CAMPEP_0171327392 /NCGR_PEP_ID=MMETSP0816-20121228/118052_1 /TAXON_ID=420281 /ORGANISM="Proboscia inermis, Strain CCAP1064/1" /LENGTH=56 /DNA_ID=CAMNT_0011827103 /DNA_START=945 /DNA_END=1115 /DNA_ORIENTATION=-